MVFKFIVPVLVLVYAAAVRVELWRHPRSAPRPRGLSGPARAGNLPG